MQPPRREERTFLGHPVGLLYLSCTEVWERFSYYGMTALLALYMVNRLLLPGHVEHIAGFTVLRRALEELSGPLSLQALAAQILGLYAGLVYLTPIAGGFIADRWIGQRTAVVCGALCMSAGHLAMTGERTFLLALAMLIIGSGLLKGNISTQVGALYPAADEARRTRGFLIFSTAINVGAVAGPFVCGLLADLYGWDYGFAAAAVLMLVGLATYLRGYGTLPARAAELEYDDAPLTREQRRVIIALVAVIGITVFQSIAYYQVYNVLPLWIQQHVANHIGPFHIPVPWYQSINALASIVGMPLVLWRWKHLAAGGREPSELTKIGIGACIAAASNGILALGDSLSASQAVSPLWPFASSVGLGVAFLYYWPTLLALVSRAAPPRVGASLMGVALSSLFVANNLIGYIGRYYERMTPTRFWLLHAAIAGGGALAVALFGRRISRRLD